MTHSNSTPTDRDWVSLERNRRRGKGWPETLAVLALMILIVILIVKFFPTPTDQHCTYGADYALECTDMR